MRQEIYKSGTLLLLLALLFHHSTAQQQPASPQKPDTEQQKDYQPQMNNMPELQKQLIALQRQQIQHIQEQSTDSLKSWRFKQLGSLQNFALVDSVRSPSLSLSSNHHIDTDILSVIDFDHLTISKSDLKKGFLQEKLIEKSKTFSKSYPADKNNKLIITNQYGKITVNTWNKNEFKVDVEIKVGTEDEAETQKLLDAVQVLSSQDQADVSFKTVISEKTSNNGFLGLSRSNGKRKIMVNYTVFMPVKNALSIANNYGSVILPDLEGPVNISNNYGTFTAKELKNDANELHLNYTTANIETLQGGNLKFNYGNLKIGTAINLKAVMGYSPVTIDRLKSLGNIKIRYGSGLKINNLDKDLKNLSIDASFTSIYLELNGSENFIFDINAIYSRFKHDESIKVQNQPESDANHRYNHNKNYKGYTGKAGSENKVNIRTNYSSINFN